MAKYIPNKDLEDLKSKVASVIHKSLGYSDSSLVTVIMNCVTSGHDKRRMTGMIDRIRANAMKFTILLEF